VEIFIKEEGKREKDLILGEAGLLTQQLPAIELNFHLK
jgi:hypothetical protein